MTANELRQDLRSWNLAQAAIFQSLNILNDVKKIMSAGKLFADLADQLGRMPSYEEFETAFNA